MLAYIFIVIFCTVNSLFSYRWLKNLNVYGVCLVTDMPTNAEGVRKVRTGLWTLEHACYYSL